jgi:hypothetical protein
MDVESIITLAVLELREQAGYRLTRKDRQDLARLRAYFEWRQALDQDDGWHQMPLWGDE